MIHTQKKSSPLLGHMVAGAAACAAVLAALLCASAALLCRIDIPLEMTVPLGTGALCLSVLAGSAVTSLLHGKNGMLCGLLFAGLAVLVVGAFFHRTGAACFFYLHRYQGGQYPAVRRGRRLYRHSMERKP